MIDPIRHKLSATLSLLGLQRIRTAYVPTLLLVLAVTPASSKSITILCWGGRPICRTSAWTLVTCQPWSTIRVGNCV